MILDANGFIDTLDLNEVFVFGSNTAGRHGRGAALIAFQKFGAVQGKGEGLYGKSYALPTLDGNLKQRTYRELSGSVSRFLRYCDRHPELTFYLTKVGCGLAGYPEWFMRGLFVEDITSNFPANLILPQEWSDFKAFLNNDL